MRFAIPAALLALVAASPASATGGFVCSAVGGKEPVISLVIGHGIPGGVVGVSLKERGRWLSTGTPKHRLVLDQSWIDKERTWVDVANIDTGAPEAQLRVRNQGFGGTGTFVRKGRTYRVRCMQD